MLNRQKLLLHLIELAGGTIDRLVLTKWAFLLRQESPTRGGESFYDFVPYHYGPFSFSLYHEVSKLVCKGYLEELGKTGIRVTGQCTNGVETWTAREVSSVLGRFRQSKRSDLIDYVYATYPKYTVNSRKKKLGKRVTASIAVYTAGYEGKSIDAFLNGLVEAGIKHLIDVRKNPIARRYGFHKSTLERLTGGLEIKYSHVPSLGIASQDRAHAREIDGYPALFRHYERTTLATQTDSIGQVAEWVNSSPSVLVCMESEPQSCHRSYLAKSVSTYTGLPIVHLR